MFLSEAGLSDLDCHFPSLSGPPPRAVGGLFLGAEEEPGRDEAAEADLGAEVAPLRAPFAAPDDGAEEGGGGILGPDDLSASAEGLVSSCEWPQLWRKSRSAISR